VPETVATLRERTTAQAADETSHAERDTYAYKLGLAERAQIFEPIERAYGLMLEQALIALRWCLQLTRARCARS
jgi:hypothetical protein